MVSRVPDILNPRAINISILQTKYSRRRLTRVSCILVVSALLVAGKATADSQADDGQRRVLLSDSSTISLITVLPGEAVYSLFGHSAVRVYDPAHNIDLSYSYGTFHFDDPLFVLKFAGGKLDYYLSVARFESALRLYRDIEGRPAVEQVLDLTPDQKNRLFEFLQTNALPENRYYRYDFLFDNCSTRIRDALKSVLGEDILYGDVHGRDRSFRELLSPYLADRPFLEVGIDLLLGARTDRIATASEETFLPDYLETFFDGALLVDEEGIERPLVLRKDSLVQVTAYARARAGVPWPAVIAALLVGLVLWLTVSEARAGALRDSIDVLLFGVTGLVGCFMLVMWFGTEHHVTAVNWNLAWAWPTHLVYAAVRARRDVGKGSALYALVNAVAAVLLIAAWNMVPQQFNIATIAVPLMTGVRATWTYLYWRKEKAGAG